MRKVITTLAYFEYQATLSRDGFNYRGVYIEGAEIFEIDKPFVKRCAEEKLFDLFPKLRGADLVYACAARVMSIPLATFDSDFQPYSEIISLYYL